MSKHQGHWKWIREMGATPTGFTAAMLADHFGLTRLQASRSIADFRLYRGQSLASASWKGQAGVKTYFLNQADADAFMLRDPVVRVVKNQDGKVRLAYGSKALDMPEIAAKGMLKKLAEVVA